MSDDAGERSLLAQERALQAAQLASDVVALELLLHPELLAVGPDGQLADRAMDLDAHRTGVYEIARLSEQDIQVRVVGETGLTFVVIDLECKINGVDASGRYRYTRAWSAPAASGRSSARTSPRRASRRISGRGRPLLAWASVPE